MIVTKPLPRGYFAEVIASDATWLMVFNRAIDRIIANNQKVRKQTDVDLQLDGYAWARTL